MMRIGIMIVLSPRSKLSLNLLKPFSGEDDLDATTDQRKSLLPVPLMFDFDAWINLACCGCTRLGYLRGAGQSRWRM